MSVAIYELLSHNHSPRLPAIAASIGRIVARWRGRIRERRALGALDYRDLQDLHLSRWEIEREMAKPFWLE